MTPTTHSLKYNGAAFGDDAELINDDTKVTSGWGRALCSCGEISEELPTGSARRAWHKAHKLDADLTGEPEEQEPVVTVHVPFTEAVAKHFWMSLGHTAADLLAENYPDVTVSRDDKTRNITFAGPSSQVEAAVAQLNDLYSVAAPTFYSWKRENGEYKSLQHNTLEGRRASYQLTKNFFVSLAHRFINTGS